MRPRPSRQRDLFEVDQKMSDIPNSQKTLLVSLAAHHSSRHPAIGVCRGKSAAPDTSRISHGSRKKRFPHEIHRRAAGHAKHANFPLGFVNKNRDS